MSSDSNWMSHPIFGSAPSARVLAMDASELRLLDNAKKGLADCDAAIESGTADDKSILALFLGLDAARKLRQKLSGHSASQLKYKGRENFIELLETCIPHPSKSGAVFQITEAETGELKEVSISELIYSARCLFVHENENLNEHEETSHSILLRWNVPTEDFILEHGHGRVVINGMLLLRRLREILSHFITALEAVITFSKTGRASITICPEIGSIKPHKNRAKGEVP